MVATKAEETPGLVFGADEAAFLAGEEHVEVVPRAHIGTLHMIAADYGPLRPGAPASVPLWLALQLRRAHHCRVVPPAWMSPAALEAAIVRERAIGAEGGLQPLPYHWAEVAHTLLHGAAQEDVPHAERVRMQLQTLRELRMAKLRAGLAENIDGGPLRLDNATSAEVQALRPVLAAAMAAFAAIHDAPAGVASPEKARIPLAPAAPEPIPASGATRLSSAADAFAGAAGGVASAAPAAAASASFHSATDVHSDALFAPGESLFDGTFHSPTPRA